MAPRPGSVLLDPGNRGEPGRYSNPARRFSYSAREARERIWWIVDWNRTSGRRYGRSLTWLAATARGGKCVREKLIRHGRCVQSGPLAFSHREVGSETCVLRRQQVARINIEDDVESQDEFRRLLQVVGGDWDIALGRLVRFFRIAQKKYGRGAAVSKDELEQAGLACMIESGWAVPWGDGYQAPNPQDHFDWYRQRVEAGAKGGRPPKEPEVTPRLSEENRNAGSANPPSPAPSPSRSDPPCASALVKHPKVGNSLTQLSGEQRDELLERIPLDVQSQWVGAFPDVEWLRDWLSQQTLYLRNRKKPVEDLTSYVTNLLRKDWPTRKGSRPRAGPTLKPPDPNQVLRVQYVGRNVEMSRFEYDRRVRDYEQGRDKQGPPVILST